LLLQALIRRERPAAFWPAIAAGSLLLTLGYGAVRISQIDARTQLSPKITVGLVQVNMGIFDKREDPREGQRRHIEDTIRLEAEVNPDLIIWPESAYTYFLPPDVENVRRYVTGRITTPLLFGGLQRREERHYNTAFMVDGEGDVIATYDKTHLLAFGEYLPFGETFPELYEWSPNSGHFTPGDHQRPLPFADYRISTLVCYEDVLPGFTRAAVREANPHLLVNITNDAWFGDTQEPWIHLALAQFRAVEHHRYLARATNSGVSAIIDPVGRITAQSGVFTRETVHGEVAMMTGWTLYQTLGSWPAWLAIAMLGWMAFGKRRARPAPSSTSPRSRRGAPPPGDRPGA
ncbi:MAG: apolipoprotein N-acyltransferase, partial [Myxococcales bacterium]|nr:apolipoprotein N-acyltransferase [Myxococcales bacterium]